MASLIHKGEQRILDCLVLSTSRRRKEPSVETVLNTPLIREKTRDLALSLTGRVEDFGITGVSENFR